MILLFYFIFIFILINSHDEIFKFSGKFSIVSGNTFRPSLTMRKPKLGPMSFQVSWKCFLETRKSVLDADPIAASPALRKNGQLGPDFFLLRGLKQKAEGRITPGFLAPTTRHGSTLRNGHDELLRFQFSTHSRRLPVHKSRLRFRLYFVSALRLELNLVSRQSIIYKYITSVNLISIIYCCCI